MDGLKHANPEACVTTSHVRSARHQSEGGASEITAK